MPYADNNGVKIYYEVEGGGPSIILGHGVGANLNIWRRVGGYVNALKNDFQLILFDARAHGRSDKPHDPADYGLKMADDIVSILDSLEIDKAHYFGFSMGGRIGYYAAKIHPDRFLSLVLGGAGVIDEATAKARAEVTRSLEKLQNDPKANLAKREKALGHAVTPEEKAEIAAVDTEALLALRASFLKVPELNKQYLSGISVPCLLYAGDADPRCAGTREAAGYIPGAKFVSLPGLDHGPSFARSDLILPVIREFLTSAGNKKRKS
jgi:pimeloyl-ACP methyl ester carboxylesterase